MGVGGGGERGRESEGLTADTARKRPERPWTAARTMEVLRRCPLAIATRSKKTTTTTTTPFCTHPDLDRPRRTGHSKTAKEGSKQRGRERKHPFYCELDSAYGTVNKTASGEDLLQKLTASANVSQRPNTEITKIPKSILAESKLQEHCVMES